MLKRFDVPSIRKLEADNAARMHRVEEILGRESRRANREGISAFMAESEENRQLLNVNAAPPSVLARIKALDRSPWIDNRLIIAVHNVEFGDTPASTSRFINNVKNIEAFDKKISELADTHVELRRNFAVVVAREPDYQDPIGLMNDDEFRRRYDVSSVLARFRPEDSNAGKVDREDAAHQISDDPQAG